jgi:large subunit ribosomal protein L29
VKSTEYLNELRTMDIPELDARLKEVRTELFNLRFQAATGQLENHRQIRNVRRQIAQVLTVLQGRRLGFDEVVSAEAATVPGATRAKATPAEAPAADPEEVEPESADGEAAEVASPEAEADSEPAGTGAPAEAEVPAETTAEEVPKAESKDDDKPADDGEAKESK